MRKLSSSIWYSPLSSNSVGFNELSKKSRGVRLASESRQSGAFYSQFMTFCIPRQPPGQRKSALGRTTVGSDDDEVEDDFDVDVEDESSKFSTSPSDEEMAHESYIKAPIPPSNRLQARQKPLSTKVSKPKTSKKPRRAVISDDDDEDGDSMPWQSDMSVDEDPPSSPPQSRVTASSSTRIRKGKSRADFEDMDVLREGRPIAIGTKRSRPSDSEAVIDSKPPSPPVGPDVTAAENKEPVLKKKLPPIKKIKLSDSTASSPVPTSKASTVKTERSKLTVEGAGLPPPPSSLPRKPAATAGNTDLDLSNADVYKQLFSVSF